MIVPRQPQTTASVAAHYDELDRFYREIWGDHVHHGYWATGRENPAEAVIALIDLLAERLRLEPGLGICDIGCGYGGTARYLAARHAVTVSGVTVSTAQAEVGRALGSNVRGVTIQVQDWLTNTFASESFDRAYSIESSEHMTDKKRFFAEAFRVLKPDGRLVVCAWLARDDPGPWEIRHLLEPICREGRLPSLGTEAEYRALAEAAGFQVLQADDISNRVRRTWWICIQRVIAKLFTQPRYLQFLLDSTATNRIFAVTLLRIMIAYRIRSMRYCILVFGRAPS